MSEQKNNANPGEKDPLLLDHNYDGIQELDHFLPRWWLGILYGSIIFAAGYLYYYEIGPGKSIRTIVAEDIRENENIRLANSGGNKPASETELMAFFQSEEKKKAGHAVFAVKCVSCHGPEGQGLIGPNLTDEYWIHGGKITDIATTVSEGVLDKGMPPWKAVLSKEELYSVVAYVKSLKGTKPANPKAPQGDVFKE